MSGNKKILKIVDGKVDSVNWNRDLKLYSVRTNNENFLYVCGEGIFMNKFGTWNEINLPTGGKNSLRVNDINDFLLMAIMYLLLILMAQPGRYTTIVILKGIQDWTLKVIF